MSISTGLDWVGNLGPNAEKAAGSVDKLAQSLRALQSIQGSGAASFGGGGTGGGGFAGVGAQAKEANKAVLIQTKSAADLAKIEATRLAQLDAINAKQGASNAGFDNKLAAIDAKRLANLDAINANNAASLAALDAKRVAALDTIGAKNAANIADADAKAMLLREQGAQSQAAIAAKAAANIAQVQAKSDVDRNRAIGRIIEGQAKAANAAALIEQQGAQKAAQIRAKSTADAARIAAKANADMARDSHRASLKGNGKAAAMSLAQGGGIQGAAGALGGSAGAIAAIGTVAVAVAAKVAGIAYEYSKAVVAAQSFKEDIQEAFKTVRGTNAAADATFQTAIANADKLGIKRADSIGQFLDLATKGFADDKIREIQGRLLDIATIDPRASQEGLTKVIGKIQATGRLNQETLNELSTFGLEQGDVIKQIGKALGKSDAEVLKTLSSSGGLRDARNVDFVLSAIAGQTGGGAAGAKAAEKADRNLSSLLDRVESIPANLLFDVKAGPGIESIKVILRDILGFFDSSSATGERTRKVLGDVFNAIAEGLLGRRMGDKEGITGTLTALLDVAEKSVPTIKATASALGTLGRAILALTSGDSSGLDTGTKRLVGAINLISSIQGAIFDIFSGGFPSVGNFIQPILDIIGIDYDASKITSFVNGVTDLLSPRNWIKMIYAGATGGDATLGNPFLTTIQGWGAGVGEWLRTGFSDVGTAMIDGLVNGITAGAMRVVDAVKGVASSALTTAKTVLGIASPSKETAALGEWYSIGMGDGIESKADYVTRAARVTAEDALLAASMPVPQLGMGASAAGRNGAAANAGRAVSLTVQGPLFQIIASPDMDIEAFIEKADPVLRRWLIGLLGQVAAEG